MKHVCINFTSATYLEWTDIDNILSKMRVSRREKVLSIDDIIAKLQQTNPSEKDFCLREF